MNEKIEQVEEEITREWVCQSCGRVLGRIVRLCNISRLDMLKERGVLITGSAYVHCLDCGEIREWHVGDDAMENLLKRHDKIIDPKND
jgi:hypothetical protein